MAEKAQCYWLLDAIASWQIEPKVKSEPFQIWHLAVNAEREGELSCRKDSNELAIASQRIPRIDFPLTEIKLYLCNNVIMLPSEY